MVDFRKLLKPETIARMDADSAKVHVQYKLTDAALAAELTTLCEQARAAEPLRRPDDNVYDSALIWHVVPEVIRRLQVHAGVPEDRQIKVLEATHPSYDLLPLSDADLRFQVVNTIHNTSTTRHHDKQGWDLLTRDFVAGNPIVFAIDRICPPVPGDREDWACRSMGEVSRARGLPTQYSWTPEFERASSRNQRQREIQEPVDVEDEIDDPAPAAPRA